MGSCLKSQTLTPSCRTKTGSCLNNCLNKGSQFDPGFANSVPGFPQFCSQQSPDLHFETCQKGNGSRRFFFLTSILAKSYAPSNTDPFQPPIQCGTPALNDSRSKVNFGPPTTRGGSHNQNPISFTLKPVVCFDLFSIRHLAYVGDFSKSEGLLVNATLPYGSSQENKSTQFDHRICSSGVHITENMRIQSGGGAPFESTSL